MSSSETVEQAPGAARPDAWRFFTFVVAAVGAVAIFLNATTESEIILIVTVPVLAILGATANSRLAQKPRFYSAFHQIALIWMAAAALLPQWLDKTPLGIGQALALVAIGSAPMFAVAIWLGARARR
ncbi:hypothetical protein [Demequina aurantiaca]|uniref:hypothetical protein n=1 Tax=Demequina aurantiaca TaxID=676200 RepID=UPI003D33E9E7